MKLGVFALAKAGQRGRIAAAKGHAGKTYRRKPIVGRHKNLTFYLSGITI